MVGYFYFQFLFEDRVFSDLTGWYAYTMSSNEDLKIDAVSVVVVPFYIPFF